jgi:alpha-D-ribose 1-methylphosphonate 5-triphosphate synthase subunit PhnG
MDQQNSNRAQADPRDAAIDQRRRWMSVLARTRLDVLEELWEQVKPPPNYYFLRRPERGLVMVQARGGGDGLRFHLGEMTVTHCVVQLEMGPTGYSWVPGRNLRHAELAALFDSLLQTPDYQTRILEDLVEPEALRQAEVRRARAAQALATKVEFYTMVRGDE